MPLAELVLDRTGRRPQTSTLPSALLENQGEIRAFGVKTDSFVRHGYVKPSPRQARGCTPAASPRFVKAWLESFDAEIEVHKDGAAVPETYHAMGFDDAFARVGFNDRNPGSAASRLAGGDGCALRLVEDGSGRTERKRRPARMERHAAFIRSLSCEIRS